MYLWRFPRIILNLDSTASFESTHTETKFKNDMRSIQMNLEMTFYFAYIPNFIPCTSRVVGKIAQCMCCNMQIPISLRKRRLWCCNRPFVSFCKMRIWKVFLRVWILSPTWNGPWVTCGLIACICFPNAVSHGRIMVIIKAECKQKSRGEGSTRRREKAEAGGGWACGMSTSGGRGGWAARKASRAWKAVLWGGGSGNRRKAGRI